MKTIPLTHLFTFFKALGGVESVLRRHQVQDREWGIQSRIVALFEPLQSDENRFIGLGLTWRDCIASCRRKYLHRVSASPLGTVVYHNAWGMPFLSGLDQANRRLSVVHSDLPVIRQIFQTQRGQTDGILCVSEKLKAQAHEFLPDFPPERVVVLPYPISSRECTPHPPLRNRPIVCGFVGRVVKEQKRVDRLPQLCQRLDQLGLDYQFEILGDGPMRPWLERQLRGNPKIVFHGRKEGDDYWRILNRWDAIIFLSDYEGLPISLLEALSLGVLPVFPQIHSGGDAYTTQVTADFLYPSGDLDRVAAILCQIKKSPQEDIDGFRQVCRRLAIPHQGDSYFKLFSEFVQQVVEWPRISAATQPARPFYAGDYLPFAFLRRFYYGGLFRRDNEGTRAHRDVGNDKA